MASVDFGTLFLDAGLRIKRFTPRVSELFNITESDENRPVTDFTHQLDYDGLVKDMRIVLEQLTPIEHELRTHTGRWFLMRARPYRTVDDKIDGVVISFVDITERRKVEESLRQSEASLRQEKRLVELSREPILVWDFDGDILDWNRGSEELYGYSREEALGRRKDELLKTSVPGTSFEELKLELLNKGSWAGEIKHTTKDGRVLTVETRIDLQPMDGRRLVLETTRDITDRKSWETRQRLLLTELTHRVKNTLTVVQAIAHQTLSSTQSSKDFIEHFEARLGALASAHSLLVESDWSGTELGELARRQLQPYVEADPDRLRLDGPPVLLPTDLATPFGLVLHELGTNAAKYGALSNARGIVNFRWKLDRTGDDTTLLSAVWQERDGPPVTNPRTTGFGSALIRRGIPNAKVDHKYRADGVVCTVELSLPASAQVHC
jgi:two-component system CheB/CheR fusion protein